jgi:putative ABC transport system ATP-binding protein
MKQAAPIIEVRGLAKHYLRGKERIPALQALSFDIPAPAVVAVAGPSGSGKSTLLNLLARFDTPDAGSIALDGERLDAIPEAGLDAFRSRKLGFVFQQFNLLPVLSARENVEIVLTGSGLTKQERRRRAGEMLERVGMGQRLDHRPTELSGGQQQRVAIARALVGKPRFVIADEPTGSLDSKTAHEILTLVDELNRETGTTFVIATHDERVMDMAHRTLRLEDGRLLA